MNLDEKISKLLKEEAGRVDALMMEEKGIFHMLAASFKGGNRFWVGLVYAVGFIVALAMVWCGYRFWIAETLQQQVFWGVSLLAAIQVQISLKMWGFMEMNRISLMREIKRIEIQLTQRE